MKVTFDPSYIYVDGAKVGEISGSKEVYVNLYNGEVYENGRKVAPPVLRIKYGRSKKTRAKKMIKAMLQNLTPAQVLEQLSSYRASPLALAKSFGYTE